MSHPNRLDGIGVALTAMQNHSITALRLGEGRGLSHLQMVQLWELELVRAGVIDPIELAEPVAFEIDDSRCMTQRIHGMPCGCVLHIKAVK